MSFAQVARRELRSSLPAESDIPLVYIVHNDAVAREGLESIISGAGWETRTFSSAAQFLARLDSRVPRCVILDVALPDGDGLALQERVATPHAETAVIFVTAHADVATVVKAMKRGAIQFFTRPFREDALLGAIGDAIEQSRAGLRRRAEARVVRDRYELLSRRERQVLALVVAGRLNKQVANELQISEITVKAHRGRVMRKMLVRSLAELVKMVGNLDLDGAPTMLDSGASWQVRNIVDLSRRAGTPDGRMLQTC